VAVSDCLWRWLWVVVVGGGCYGASIGLWRAPAQAGWVAVKMALLILVTLGVNGVFNGMMAAVLATGLALSSLLLMALAPVVWLFAQATAAIGFMSVLALAFWLVAIGFGLRLILRGARLRGARLRGATSTGLLATWALIFLTVTLQMSTTLRPILGTAGRLLPGERRFFLEHWARSLGDSRP